MKDSKREYPVCIDPTFVWNNTNAERLSTAYICSSSPTKTYTDKNTNILCVGKRNTNSDVCRAFMNFGGLNTLVTGSYVDKAILKINTTSASSDMPIYARLLTSNWSASTVNYSNQPEKYEGVLGQAKTTKSSETIKMTLDADMIYDMSRNKETMYGIELSDSEDDSNKSSSKSAWVFNGVSMNGTKIPSLEIEYYDNIDKTISPQIQYKVYQEGKGWSKLAEDGITAGDIKSKKPITALQFNIVSNCYINTNYDIISIRGCYDNNNWTDWVSGGGTIGNISDNKKLKAIQMKCSTNYWKLYYRVCDKEKGWLGWTSDEVAAGNTTSNGSIVGIQAILVPGIQEYYEYLDENNKVKTNGAPGICTNSSIYKYSIAFGSSTQIRKSESSYKYKVYLKNGTCIEGKTPGNSYKELFGGDSANYIVGCGLSFNSVNMKAKYDIIHRSCGKNAKDEDCWKKNEDISGKTNNDEGPLEMLRSKVVPKSYVEGKKSCISDGFVFGQDSFSFENCRAGFGYYNIVPTSKIPQKVLFDIFGEKKGKNIFIYQSNEDDWHGSCFGVCALNWLLYNNKYDISPYLSVIDKHTESLNGIAGQNYKKNNKKVTRLIELLQAYCTIGARYDGDLEDIVNILLNNPNKIYILSMLSYSVDADHALIAYGINKLSNGKYKVLLYNPNLASANDEIIIDLDYNTAYYRGVKKDIYLNILEFSGEIKEQTDKIFSYVKNNEW